MELVDGRLIFSASDLINHLECPHLTHLNIEVTLGREEIEQTRSDTTDSSRGRATSTSRPTWRSCAPMVASPPGSGKTYTGAHLILHLIARGHRVGVASGTHAAIHNLLAAVEDCAPADAQFSDLKKCGSDGGNSYEPKRGLIGNSKENADFAGGEHELVAGTAWLFCREELDATLDYLVIDEAVHRRNWRMHPDVCRFISRAIYEDRPGPSSRPLASHVSHSASKRRARRHPVARPVALKKGAGARPCSGACPSSHSASMPPFCTLWHRLTPTRPAPRGHAYKR
jgi:hypothetical protein